MSSSTGTIDHVVLLTVKPEVTDDQFEKVVEGAKACLEIPGVISLSIGTSFVESWMSDRRKGYTHALHVRLESKEALQVYQDHPIHVEAKKLIAAVISDIMAIDWVVA